ncbi:hypothetical protein [Nonomuraea dietziae]|uniref:hypothetical protein n=1 Tax=Nonomuraea dietziae TaxID=65515 RepID=UPI0031D4EBA9
MSRRAAGRDRKADPWRLEALKGWQLASGHPLFGHYHRRLVEDRQTYVTAGGDVHYDTATRADAAEWAWTFAHLMLHLGFGHADPGTCAPADLGPKESDICHLPDPAYLAACCVAVDRFLTTLKLGRNPAPLPATLPTEDEVTLSERWRGTGVPAEHAPLGPRRLPHRLTRAGHRPRLPAFLRHRRRQDRHLGPRPGGHLHNPAGRPVGQGAELVRLLLPLLGALAAA